MNQENFFMRVGIKMGKIPVKIVEVTSPSGVTKKGVMLDVVDFLDLPGDAQKQLKKFEKIYFQTVEKAEKLFFGDKKGKKKKYQHLPSSVYWKLGNLLLKFDENVKNEFTITNYAESVFRDFGLSKDYVYDLLTIAKMLKKSDIIDVVPFSYYRALKRKSNQLKKLDIFKQELKRLNKMGVDSKLPGRETYKIELIDLIENQSMKKMVN